MLMLDRGMDHNAVVPVSISHACVEHSQCLKCNWPMQCFRVYCCSC